MEQKIISVGNSMGIIIPQSLLKKTKLSAGKKIYLEIDQDGNIVIKKNKNELSSSSITPKFVELLEKVNKNYGAALKELAKR